MRARGLSLLYLAHLIILHFFSSDLRAAAACVCAVVFSLVFF